jgi:hypothetical protein
LNDETEAASRLAAEKDSQEWGAVEANGELGFLRARLAQAEAALRDIGGWKPEHGHATVRELRAIARDYFTTTEEGS